MMTLQQQAVKVIEHLPDEKILQVIQFAKFLSADSGFQVSSKHEENSDDSYIRKPGVLKRRKTMAENFDETPECMKEYM